MFRQLISYMERTKVSPWYAFINGSSTYLFIDKKKLWGHNEVWPTSVVGAKQRQNVNVAREDQSVVGRVKVRLFMILRRKCTFNPCFYSLLHYTINIYRVIIYHMFLATGFERFLRCVWLFFYLKTWQDNVFRKVFYPII